MRLKKILQGSLLIIFLLNPISLFSQDGRFAKISGNIPFPGEIKPETDRNVITDELVSLDRSYKLALESGNDSKAERIKLQMYALIPADMISKTSILKSVLKPDEKIEIPESDWTTSDQLIHVGMFNSPPGYPRQLNMKLGEDGNLYSAICYFDNYNSFIRIYKSTNMGESWNILQGIGGNGRIRGISMLVESRSNLIPDSTRIFVFYTMSDNRFGYENASLNYYSIRSNNTDFKYGEIALPGTGNTISEISAVSDGAFYQNATYPGVVCTEADNTTNATKKIRFFRTIDWCNTWVSSTINTSFDDRCISAGFKNSTTDSVYLAVERYFNETEHGIRVLAMPWTPSSMYQIYYITLEPGIKYEKPCLTVPQNYPGNSALITCTKDNIPVYHCTSNGGSSWITDYTLNYGNNSKKLYTFCSSSPAGSTPYTTCVLTMNGDSVNVRRGVLGAMGEVIYKVNGSHSTSLVMPVCELIKRNNRDLTIVAYANSISNVYSNQEGSKTLAINVIPQGLYNANTNFLNISDTINVYLRKAAAPYEMVDSVKGLLYFSSLYYSAKFNSVQDGSYYVVVKHRNSLETWLKNAIDFTVTGDKAVNLNNDSSLVYGNNMIRVDNFPVRYGMYSGDVNRDGAVDLSDVLRINNDAGVFTSGYVVSDLTGNSIVDLSDVVLAQNNSSVFAGVKRP